MKTQQVTFIDFWNHIKLRSKPSYTFFTLSILFGLITGNILGGTLGLALAWAFERIVPPKPLFSKGIMRNRTKGIINIIVVALLFRMANFYIEAAQLDSYNNVGRIAGVSTEWAFGSSAGHRIWINCWSFVIAAWLGYQASLAKRICMVNYRWIFASFAVVLLPFVSFFLGPLWLLVVGSLMIFLLISSITFRLPLQWPVAAPLPLPIQPETQVGMIEKDLTILKRLLDSGMLSQEEFSFKKQEILLRPKR